MLWRPLWLLLLPLCPVYGLGMLAVLALPAVRSGYETNLEEILALDPQVVIMNDMAHTVEQVSLLEQNGVKVITTNADSIAMIESELKNFPQIKEVIYQLTKQNKRRYLTPS